MDKLKNTDLLNFIKTNKTFLFEKYNLTKIGVFGSFARSEQSDDSDIDLVVEFKRNTDKCC